MATVIRFFIVLASSPSVCPGGGTYPDLTNPKWKGENRLSEAH
jgi:hypothetical protein